MINTLRYVSPLIVVLLMLSDESMAEQLQDPYRILEKHYAAIGGLDRLKAEGSRYMEAEFELVGTGLEGSLKQWNRSPVMERQEMDLGVFKQISGDDGDIGWVLDNNGQLKILRDEDTVNARHLKQLMGEYAHLDPESPVFTVTLEGVQSVEGMDCYEIRIRNSINSSEQVYFIDTSEFLTRKSIIRQTDGGEFHSVFSDFRDSDGMVNAYRQDSTALPIGQKQKVTITKLELDLDIPSTLFAPPEEGSEDFRFLNGTSAENVDFLFHENHIYLQVTVNAEKKLWVLDSGAGATVIDKSFADELGLEEEGEFKGQGVNNTLELAFVTLPGMKVEGIEFDEQRVVSLDLSHLFKQLGDLEVGGILGYDFASRFVTRIDYANEKISFYHPDAFKYEGEGVVIDSPVNSHNMFTLPMSVDGGLSGIWRFDTGATGSSFHYEFAKENGLLERPGVERQSFGAGGSHVSMLQEFPGATIGGFELPALVFGVPYSAGHGALAEKSLVGNLGSNVFRHFVLYMDYDRQQIILEKGDDFGKEFPHNNSGLQYWFPNGEKRVEIRFVAAATAGDVAGFKVDDRVLSINHIPVERLDGLHAVNELMKAPPGTSYTFAILREGEELQLELILKDPFN